MLALTIFDAFLCIAKLPMWLVVLFFVQVFTMFALVLALGSVVEKSLGKFVDERKAQMLKDKGLPLEGAALVAGRTDKGVTAVHQVCSFCMLQPHSL